VSAISPAIFNATIAGPRCESLPSDFSNDPPYALAHSSQDVYDFLTEFPLNRADFIEASLLTT